MSFHEARCRRCGQKHAESPPRQDTDIKWQCGIQNCLQVIHVSDESCYYYFIFTCFRITILLSFCDSVAFYGAYLTSLLPICFFLSASYRNYPGGAAMARLNADIERSLRSRGAIRTRSDANGLWDCINATDASSFEPVRVHIDVLACVSGVTR